MRVNAPAGDRGGGDRIRTDGLLVANQALCQTELHPRGEDHSTYARCGTGCRRRRPVTSCRWPVGGSVGPLRKGPAGQSTGRDAVCHRDPALDQHADIESLLHGVERLVPEDGPAYAFFAL